MSHAFDTTRTIQQISIEEQPSQRLKKNALISLGMHLHSKLRYMRDLLIGPPPLITERPKRRISSSFIRYVDAGSCGDCEVEFTALANPYYDWERLGFRLTASPCHADVLVVAGPFTHAMESAVLAAYEAMPEPRRIVTVGRIAHSPEELEADEIYRDSYAVIPLPEQLSHPVIWIKHKEGDSAKGERTTSIPEYQAHADPPEPMDLLEGLLKQEESNRVAMKRSLVRKV